MAETVKTMYLENCVARIHIPDLTEEQKKKQMDKIKAATAKFLFEVENALAKSEDKTA